MPFARKAGLFLALVMGFAFCAGQVVPQTLSQSSTAVPGSRTPSAPSRPPEPSGLSPSSSASASPNTEFVKAWGPVIVGVLAILLSSWFNNLQVRQARAELTLAQEKARTERETSTEQMQRGRSEQERADIAAKLNSFYGPFKQLRAQSQLFYRYFALSQKREAQKNGKPFRTLLWLAKGEHISDADRELLVAILKVSSSLLKLIETQTGVVDKPALQDLLGKYAAHIRLLKLASAGKLPSLDDNLSELAYPRAIDGAIESAVLRLQDRQRELTSAPSISQPPLAAPTSSIEYYNKNAESYVATTAFLDLRELYNPFRENLLAGARILDAGCGSGRDTRAFIELGYRVVSVDASSEMVRKCRDYPHAYCVQADLLELSFKEEFDAIWACAVLLHLSQDDAWRAVQNLVTALKPGGYLFISVKQGVGSITESDGRFFQYYDENSLRDLLKRDSRVAPGGRVWSSRGVQEKPTEQIWINALVKRVPGPPSVLM